MGRIEESERYVEIRRFRELVGTEVEIKTHWPREIR